MTDPPRLVVGASGILAPLAVELSGCRAGVLAVGRRPGRLVELAASAPGRLGVLAADASTPEGTAEIARHGPFAAAVVYAPALGATDPAPLLRSVSGRAVLVLTSAVADPDAGEPLGGIADRRRPRAGDGVLVLGWAPDPVRWHTPEEVSRAAFGVLRGGDRVLGRLRPWSERPE